MLLPVPSTARVRVKDRGRPIMAQGKYIAMEAELSDEQALNPDHSSSIALEIDNRTYEPRRPLSQNRRAILWVVSFVVIVAVALITTTVLLKRGDKSYDDAETWLCQQNATAIPDGWVDVQSYAFAMLVSALHLQPSASTSDANSSAMAMPALSGVAFSSLLQTKCLILRAAPATIMPGGISAITLRKAGASKAQQVCGEMSEPITNYVNNTLLEGSWQAGSSGAPCSDVMRSYTDSVTSAELVMLSLPDSLDVDSYEMWFEFKLDAAVLQSGTFQTADGATKSLLAGQLRLAFSYGWLPLLEAGQRFDRGIPYNITITVPPGVTALANTPVLTQQDLAGQTRFTFEQTHGEAANMIGFAAGQLQQFVLDSAGGPPVLSVYALAGALAPEDVQISLQAARHALDFWTAYTATVAYVPKLDMVIHTGSSEWSSSHSGLLLMDRYRTLWNPASGTASDLLRSVNVICHEVGHIWFAGLVSAASPTDRFLIEGMTSYLEDKCVEGFLPALSNSQLYSLQFAPPFGDTKRVHEGTVFTSLDMLTAPGNDAPINTNSTTDVTTFSYVNYYKSAAFMHMLEEYAHAVVAQGAIEDAIKQFFTRCKGRASSTHEFMFVVAARLANVAYDELFGWDPNSPDAPLSTDENVLMWHDRLMAWMTQPSMPLVSMSQSLDVPLRVDLAQNPACRVRTALTGSQSSEPACQVDATSSLTWWIPLSFGSLSPSAVATQTPAWTEMYPGLQISSEDNVLPANNVSWLPKVGGASALYLVNIDRNSVVGQNNSNALALDASFLSLPTDDLASAESSGIFPDSSVPALLAAADHLNDHRLASMLQPSTDAYAYLHRLLISLASAPMVKQSGAAAYSLLSPVLQALADVALLTTGLQECWDPLQVWMRDALLQPAEDLWTKSLGLVSGSMLTDVSKASQDAFFTIMTTAAVAPWAAKVDARFAETICSLVPPNAATYSDVTQMNLPPDLTNVVLEVAIANPTVCTNVTTSLTQILFQELQARSQAVNAHEARSLTFLLSSSPDLAFVRDQLLPQVSSTTQLRAPDVVALFRRILMQGPDRREMLAAYVEGLAARMQQLAGAAPQLLSADAAQAQLLAAVLGEAALLTTPASAALPPWTSTLPLQDASTLAERQRMRGLSFQHVYDSLVSG